jgi:hypothetical protein
MNWIKNLYNRIRLEIRYRQEAKRTTQTRSIYLQMKILGISAGFHDAAATVIIVMATFFLPGTAERYSKAKE